MIAYWFKVWFLVSSFIVFGYLGSLLFNLFMDWAATFSEQQILVGIGVFISVATASTMAWLRWIG
ncbi:MAG: hypothetical protein K940chlam2_00851, partial [Chlamydiae bacterium]|nr:hypothetical protein [Chlamydiota bacterium]